ncbi:MFS transporter [Paenibacillus thiaminolyticus]|nr:MFS transporter [Paenibacillus thiaminolyticus]
MDYKKLKIPIIMISLPLIFFDVLLPLYTKELGFTTFQFTILISVFSMSQLIMRLILGKVSDKYSRRSIFISSLLCFVVAYFVFAVATKLSILLIGRVINGVANILLTISLFGMIADTNSSFAQKLGGFGSNRNFGGLIGVGLSFFILSRYELLNGWTVLFAFCGAVAALAIVYSLIVSRASEQKRMTYLHKFVFSPEKRKIWFVNVLFCLLSSMIVALLIPYLQAGFEADIKEIAITFLLPMLVSSFSGSFLGKFGDRIGYRKATTLSVVISFITITTIVFSFRLSIFSIFWTLFIISYSTFNLSLDAMFFKGTPEEHIGDAYGKYSIGSNLGMIIGPALGGFLFDTYGPTVPYIIFAVSMALLVPLLLTMLPKDEPDHPVVTIENRTHSHK